MSEIQRYREPDRLAEIGRLLRERADEITETWMARAVAALPNARSAHRREMRNRVPDYLRSLADVLLTSSNEDGLATHQAMALDHGQQRWDSGWRIEEVVGDYQLLRQVVIEELYGGLGSLSRAETLAVNDFLDHGIMNAISTFVACSEQELRRANDLLERRVAKRTSDLEQRRRQIRKLSVDLVHAEEDERKRLASVLHDHLQQCLVAVKMRLGILGCDNVAEIRNETNDLMNECIETTRTLAVELSPTVLQGEGLAAALQWLGKWMHDKYGLRVEVQVPSDSQEVAEETSVSLYQAVRELLFNVVKHSGEKSAFVAMSANDDDWIAVEVSDTGMGFDAEKTEPAAKMTGFGLRNIRDRIELLGGRFEIESRAGQGTRAKLAAPRQPLENV